MIPPTAAQIRSASRVDFEEPELNYPVPDGADPDPLQPVVDQAVAYVTFVTARKYDASIPVLLEPIMLQVARMRTEQIVQESTSENAETAGDFDLLTSFTAGPYSENRRSMSDANEAKAGMLNPWPALNRLLWLLLGLTPGETNADVDDRRDYWFWVMGRGPAPAWQVVEVDWRANTVYGDPIPGLSPVAPLGWPYGW